MVCLYRFLNRIQLIVPIEVLTHVLSHLPPASLADVAFVSKRFHELVTTPHAWRTAFSRYFPGPEALNTLESNSERSDEDQTLRVERRLFTRLTALASWRSEYILRTRLLRALGRGKPMEFADSNRIGSAGRSNQNKIPVAQVTYNTNHLATITHIHANFGTTLNKRSPKFIHGADEYGAASMSDPRLGKIDAWGSSDAFTGRQFADVAPGDAQYGLGSGEIVGVPNVMDVSQSYGMIYGEGLAAGRLWYRSTEEKKGRTLLWTRGAHDPIGGIPALMDGDAVCSVWIAKSSAVPDMTEGLIGILSGSSTGVLTSYSLGTSGLRDRRFDRGQITARWILSPGVPIIAIVVDEDFSTKRLSSHRIWAVVLNALGEIFYLDDIPKQSETARLFSLDRASNHLQPELEKLAWATGRTVQWSIAEPTRRLAKPDPFDQVAVDGSYSPRSSCDKNGLHPEQLAVESKEIASFLRKRPKDFQKICNGWDMQRKLEVDFASSGDNGAGEGVFVIKCGLGEGQQGEIKRFTRCKVKEEASHIPPFNFGSTADGNGSPSIFGGTSPSWSSGQSSPPTGPNLQKSNSSTVEEWRTSSLTFGGLRTPQITATAIDTSIYGLLTVEEDPLLSATLSSEASSPMSTPLKKADKISSPGNVPGQRARFLAVGSKNGTVFLWNMRASPAGNAFLESSIKPVRIIYTDSPQISCLALTALYLVHGGNDGLVQAWDPLASNPDPIRTINSRFSSRARRRLVQAEASAAGVGINLFAAGAICLDPDATVLRGMVSLGTHLRYWSYSSLGADQYKGKKRRPHHSERSSNQGGDRFHGTGRSALKDYIANEKLELEREKRNKSKEEERLAGRFGVDLLGPEASEADILAYATMLSEEAAQVDERKRRNSDERSSSSDTITEDAAASPWSSPRQDEPSKQEEDDIAEAIRQSLEISAMDSADTHDASMSLPIKYAKKRAAKSPFAGPADEQVWRERQTQELDSEKPTAAEADDFDYALQLSLAEEQSRTGSEVVPDSAIGGGKGKGRET